MSRPGFCPRRPLALALGWALLLAGPARGLDFQLNDYSFVEDGLTYHGTYFQKDPQTRVAIKAPEKWSASGGGPALTMVPQNSATSLIRLEKSPLPPQTPFKDKGLEDYRQKVLASVVAGATSVRIAEEHDNAFAFFDWHAYEFVVSYDFYGQTYLRSSLFVNISATEQFLLTTVAPKADYKETQTRAIAVLRSWQVLSSAPR